MAIASVLKKPKGYEIEDKEGEERCPVLWSREDAQQLADIGLIPERYELIEGVIYEKMGQKPPHRHVIRTVNKWLQDLIGYDYVMTQTPVQLTLPHPNDGDLEPDIVVLNRPETEIKDREATAFDIMMCVEIAYTSLSEDTTRKASIYAQNGIVEYWVVDVKRRQIIVHREPTPNGYHQIKIFTETETLTPLSHPDAAITVGELVPATETPTE